MYIAYPANLNVNQYQEKHHNLCTPLINIIQHVNNRVIKDSILTGSEAQEFIGECDQILLLLSKVTSSTGVVNPETPVIQEKDKIYQENLFKETNILIKRVTEIVQTVKELTKEYINGEDKHEKVPSTDTAIQWKIKNRPALAKQIRDYAQTEAEAILPRIKDLEFYYQLDKASKQQSVNPIRQYMSEESYWFWVVVNSDHTTTECSWERFINHYELLYGALDPHTLESTKQLLCQNNKVSVSRLILATREHNIQFPFPKNIDLPSLSSVTSDTKGQMSEEKRMKLTEMATGLVEKFSDAKMRDHLVAIYSWYCGYDKKNKKAMRERANEWAELIKERRKIIAENKKELLQAKHEEAERIDQARRAVYFFYEQYVTMWRVGAATREILRDVEFPGKGRIRDFLNFVAPLDQANFYIVIGGSKGKNDEKKEYRPKVYDFMEIYLKMLEEQSKEHKKHHTSQKIATDDSK